jgi:hypothetical protein
MGFPARFLREESMIFWTSKPDQQRLPGLKRTYAFSTPRLVGALVIVAVLVGIAYGFHLLNWDPGQTLFLTFAQTVFGGIAGIYRR